MTTRLSYNHVEWPMILHVGHRYRTPRSFPEVSFLHQYKLLLYWWSIKTMCGHKCSLVTTDKHLPRWPDVHSYARLHIVEESRKQLWFITVERQKSDSVLYRNLHLDTSARSCYWSVKRDASDAHKTLTGIISGTVQTEDCGCPDLQCWWWASASLSKLTGNVW